jgi:outer membrane receptor protein involved in Fe transport
VLGAGKPGQYAVEAVGMGARRTRTNLRLPGHVITNLVVSKRFADLDVSVGVYNVFNHRYADPASFEIREDSIQKDGRTYRVKLTYAF